ncbi:MAG: hypothetical protein M1828_001399 [Chrysothrix sp. TS-e1954]|nr:MAG: hypothetical protein M1828_001399 [Chrysothrix sp. TS-e1954]
MATTARQSDSDDSANDIFVSPEPEGGMEEDTSQPDDVYDVECIVMEHEGEWLNKDSTLGKGKLYLLKWEGYEELYDMTWEDESNVIEGGEAIFRAWDQRKMRIERGLQEPFDYTAWEEAVKRHDQETQREAIKEEDINEAEKAAKLDELDGLFAGSDGEDDVYISSPATPTSQENEERPVATTDEPATISSPRKRAVSHDSDSDIPLMKRQKTDLTKDASSESRRASSSGRIPQVLKKKRQPEASPFIDPRRSAPTSRSNGTRVSSLGKVTTATRVPASQNFMPRPQHLGKAIFGDDWATSKPQRHRGKGDSENPFVNLSIANRANKHRPDRPPDYDKVQALNLHTGETRTPFAKVDEHRRREDMRGPTETQPIQLPLRHTTDLQAQDPRRPTEPRLSSNFPLYTCSNWRDKGKCLNFERCAFEHTDTGHYLLNNRLPSRDMTCLFWYRSHCKWSAEACNFAHAMRHYLAPTTGFQVTKLDINAEPPSKRDRNYGTAQPVEVAREVSIKSSSAKESTDRDNPPRGVGSINDRKALNKVSENDVNDDDEPKGKLGCWDHNMMLGGCTKTPETCSFSHGRAEWIAGRRGGEPFRNPQIPSRKVVRAEPAPKTNYQSYNKNGHDDQSNTSRQTVGDSGPDARNREDGPLGMSTALTSTHHNDKKQPDGRQSRKDQNINSAETQKDTDSTDLSCKLQATLSLSNGQGTDESTASAISIEGTMTGLNQNTLSRLLKEGGVSPRLVGYKSLDADKTRQLAEAGAMQTLAEGSFQVHRSSSAALETLAEHLQLRRAAACCYTKSLRILIFGAVQPEWKFLKRGRPSDSDANLRYHISSLLKPAEIPVLENDDTPTSVYPDLEINRLVTWSWQTKDVVAKVAILIGHPSRKMEIEILTDHLQEHDITVYHAASTGAWRFFCSQYKSGIVFFHNSFSQFHTVENLNNMLETSQYRYNFFDFGFKHTDPAVDLTYKLDRLFPQGQAVFIMDDCFVDHAHDTREVVRSICDTITKMPTSRITRRIFGRPNLIDWLKELATREDDRNVLEQGELANDHDSPKDDIFVQLHTLSIDHRNTPEVITPLVTPKPEVFDLHSTNWEMDPVSASSDMAAWFSAWSENRVHEVRRFFIISMMSSEIRERWKSDYKHIKVMTPEAYMSEEVHKKNVAKAKARRIWIFITNSTVPTFANLYTILKYGPLLHRRPQARQQPPRLPGRAGKTYDILGWQGGLGRITNTVSVRDVHVVCFDVFDDVVLELLLNGLPHVEFVDEGGVEDVAAAAAAAAAAAEGKRGKKKPGPKPGSKRKRRNSAGDADGGSAKKKSKREREYGGTTPTKVERTDDELLHSDDHKDSSAEPIHVPKAEEGEPRARVPKLHSEKSAKDSRIEEVRRAAKSMVEQIMKGIRQAAPVESVDSVLQKMATSKKERGKKAEEDTGRVKKKKARKER